jgi:hypothetical protein
MNPMPMIKRHLVLIACGALAAVSIAGIVLGFLFCDLSAEMEKANRIAGDLSRMRNTAVNDKFIESAKRRSDEMLRDYANVMAFVKQVNSRKPLREGVFPNPRSTSDRYEFKRDYQAALKRLPQEVGTPPMKVYGGSEPSDADIAAIKDRMDRAQMKASNQAKLGVGGQEAGRPGGEAFGGQPVEPGMPAEPGANRPPTEQTMSPEELVRVNPEARASLERAKELRWYVSRGALYASQEVIDTEQPGASQMWFAQLTLWLQEDVVRAIATLNNAEAERLQAAKRADDIWVAYMPVKELVGFYIGDYVTGTGAPAGARTGAFIEAAAGGPAADPTQTFTHRKVDPLYDVVSFAVLVVIDAQSLPAVLDALSGVNFFAPTSVTYREFRAGTATGLGRKIYGPSPLLLVRIEFDAYLFREFFHAETLMPSELKSAIEQGSYQPKGMAGALPAGGAVPR